MMYMSPCNRNRARRAMETEFWKYKTLEELDQDEWEALCDGCGRCCLLKIEDADSGELFLHQRDL